MKALTYLERGKFALIDKPKPDFLDERDASDCAEILRLIEQGRLDTTPLITHRYRLKDIEEAYRVFEGKLDGVIKVAVET